MKDKLLGLMARLRAIVFRRATEREMDDELRFHLEMETEKNLQAGMPPDEARRRARVAFGGVERHRERLREGRRAPVVEPLWRDLRMAWRAILREPGFAIVAVVTIAVGVGSTTAVASMANAVLFKRLNVPNHDRLYTINEKRMGQMSSGTEGMRIPYTRYEAYVAGTGEVFEALAAHRFASFALRLDNETIPVRGALTSGNYFSALPAPPAVGRYYREDDAAEVVLGYAVWQARFAGDPDIVGRTAWINSQPYVVVGVAPQGFVGTTSAAAPAVWMPLGAHAVGRGAGFAPTWVGMFGSIRPGVDPAQVQAVVEAVALRTPPLESITRVRGADLTPVRGISTRAEGNLRLASFMGMLLALAWLVLLIAASNIAGVLLARSFARGREIAVRLAIGAGRGQIVRHLLVESLLLFAFGGVAGILLAYVGTAWLAASAGPDMVIDLAPDPSVLLFALGVTALTGVAFGLAPALQASCHDLTCALKSGGHVGAARGGRGRSVFVTAQVAMSALLLLGATLSARSLQRGLNVDPGFDPTGVVVATTDLAPHGYDEARGREFYRRLVDEVRVLPGVEHAALSQFVLSGGGGRYLSDVTNPDAPPDAARGTYASFDIVDAEFFKTMGLGLISGAGINESHGAGTAPVVVVNETLAERLWPGESPLGRRMGKGTEEFEVVGVARNGRYVFVFEQPGAYAFQSFAQSYRARMRLHVRAPGAEAATLRAIRQVVRGLDPNVATEDPALMTDIIALTLFTQKFAAQLGGLFGLIGLLLAALGVYGVLAFHVAQRSRELCIRRALGAQNADLVAPVLLRAAVLASVGCVVGLGLGGGGATLMRSFLVGIEPLDPPTFIGVPVVLLLVALLASYLPAARATRVDTMAVLREE